MSVGPFLKALGAAVFQGNIHETRLSRIIAIKYGNDFEICQKILTEVRVVFSIHQVSEPRARLSAPAAENPIPGRSVHRKTLRQPARASRKARSESRRNHLASAMPTLHSPSGRKRVFSKLTRRPTAAGIHRS